VQESLKMSVDRRQFGLGALAASTTLASAVRPRPAQAAPVRIRVGWVVVPTSAAPLVLAKKELLANFGKSYVAEAIHFEGTPPVITALAAGELEIGPLAFSSFALAIQNAHMDDLRVICDEIQDGVPMRAMLAEKKADLISAVPPFSLDPNLTTIARTLFTQKDAFGITRLTVWTARTGFIAANRAPLVDFLEDVIRAIGWYTDPKNHKEAVASVARLNKAPPARMAFTSQDQYRDPNGMPNMAALQRNLSFQKQVGFLRENIDAKKYSDLSMVEEAAKRVA
jgi:ABC-type nitrate/sulfonate/bicarbonate transport system substrate-binding protein